MAAQPASRTTHTKAPAALPSGVYFLNLGGPEGVTNDPLLRCVTIRATATTIRLPAARMRPVTGSPATAQPSTTAMPGFTKAYVPAVAGGTTWRSQLYAVNATS